MVARQNIMLNNAKSGSAAGLLRHGGADGAHLPNFTRTFLRGTPLLPPPGRRFVASFSRLLFFLSERRAA